MAEVKLYAGEDYAWGWQKPKDGGIPQLTMTLSIAGADKLKAAFGSGRRRVWQTADGDSKDPREHMIYTDVAP